MRILAHNTLIAFYRRYVDSETAIEDWYHKTLKSTWKNFSDLKKTFNSADSIGNQRYVFNIKGNKYRIVAIVKFQIGMVYIRFIGTHSEYNSITDIKNI